MLADHAGRVTPLSSTPSGRTRSRPAATGGSEHAPLTDEARRLRGPSAPVPRANAWRRAAISPSRSHAAEHEQTPAGALPQEPYRRTAESRRRGRWRRKRGSLRRGGAVNRRPGILEASGSDSRRSQRTGRRARARPGASAIAVRPPWSTTTRPSSRHRAARLDPKTGASRRVRPQRPGASGATVVRDGAGSWARRSPTASRSSPSNGGRPPRSR